MLQRYRVVVPTFWTGETGKHLRACGRDAQVVALYLVTGPMANMIGLYYLPLPTLMHEVGISKDGALKALRCLSEGAFAHYDAVSEHVWVPEFARYQLGAELSPGDKRIKAVVTVLHEASKSLFAQAFYERYRKAYHLPTLHFDPPRGRGIEAPSKPPRSQEQEQEQDLEQEQEQEQKADPVQDPHSSALALSLTESESPMVTTFARFWDAYPNKIDKQEAHDLWKKMRPSAELVAIIMVALERQKQGKRWLDEGGQFVPSPARWLRRKKWEDQESEVPNVGKSLAGSSAALRKLARGEL